MEKIGETNVYILNIVLERMKSESINTNMIKNTLLKYSDFDANKIIQLFVDNKIIIPFSYEENTSYSLVDTYEGEFIFTEENIKIYKLSPNQFIKEIIKNQK